MPRKGIKSTAKTTVAVKNEAVSEVVETASISKKAEYNAEDGILCRSVTSGGLYVSGEKTKILYTFADYGDEQEIEYQDLIYMIRSRSKIIYDPRIYILDDELVSQHPELETLYGTIMSTDDVRDIVNLPAAQMQKVIKEMPKGMLEALKGQIATMIDNHTLDSVTKIKALDELLGTNHLLMLAQN